MFKPVEFYIKEKKAKNMDTDSIIQDWSKLTAKQRLKYIKQAETSYDKYVEDNKKEATKINPFNYFLHKSELQLLFESYGLPEKLPQNSKAFLMQKLKNEAVDGTSMEQIKKEAEEKWANLKSEERAQLLQEFYKLTSNYHEKYFNFARNLPNQRVEDYLSLVNPNIKSVNPNIKRPLKGSRSQAEASAKDFRCKFSPLEQFYEKHQSDYTQYPSLFIAKSKARTAYLNLSDKKKLKFIKKAEEKYDSHKVESIEQRPLLSSILSKGELKLLFESYGMPEPVAVNLTGYYLQLHIGDFKENHMKNVMVIWSTLTEAEKAKIGVEHAEKLNAFKEANQKFQERLPIARVADYQYYVQHFIKKHKTNASTTEPKKSIELVDTASGVSDVESDLEISATTITNGTHKPNEVDVFVEATALHPENELSAFVNEELSKNENRNLSENESKQLLNKICRKWFKLTEADKQKYEEELKNIKKSVKKSIKTFMKEHSDLNLDFDDLKSKIKKYSDENNLHLKVQFEDGTTESVNLYDKNSLDIIDSDVEEIEVKKEKKSKHNSDESPEAKRFKQEPGTSPKKK